MSTTLPNLNLTSDFVDGVDNWGTSVNTNFCILDALTHINLNSFVASLPGSANPGEAFILTTDNSINVWDGSAFDTFTPKNGMLAIEHSAGIIHYYDGSAWVNYNNTILGLALAGPINGSVLIGNIDTATIDAPNVNGTLDNATISAANVTGTITQAQVDPNVIHESKAARFDSTSIPNPILTHNTTVNAPINATEFSNSAIYSLNTGTYELTVNETGVYNIYGLIRAFSGAPLDFETMSLSITVNGSTARVKFLDNLTGIETVSEDISYLANLNAGDVVTMRVRQTNTGATDKNLTEAQLDIYRV